MLFIIYCLFREVDSPSHSIQGSRVLLVVQVKLPGQDVDLLQGHRHPRPVLAALATREANT